MKSWISICLFFVLVQISSLFALTQVTKSLAKGLTYPGLSPDGSHILFTLDGDIWVVGNDGGSARRLTLHEADDLKARWSPDGKWIAFTSLRSGNPDIWVMPAEGGAPQQLTFHSSHDHLCDWTPDGQWLLFTSLRSGGDELWKISTQGGMPYRLTYHGGGEGSFSLDGKSLVFGQGEVSIGRKNYQGVSNWNLYLSDSEGTTSRLLNDYSGNDITPFFSQDGKLVYYLSAQAIHPRYPQKLNYNLRQISIETGEMEALTQMGKDVQSPHFSLDRKTVVFEMNYQIWKMDLDTKKPKQVPITVSSDIKEQEKIRFVTEGNEMGHWSPDGTQIAFVLNRNIWRMPSFGGEAKALIEGNDKKEWPRYSPDGKYIAYASDQNKNSDIYLYSLKTKSEVQLTKHSSNDFFHNWSPDSKSLVFTSERSGNRDLWLISVDGGDLRQVTHKNTDEDDAAFSPDGRWIAYDSGKGASHEIWVMPVDGTEDDARALTSFGELCQVPTWSPDSRWIAYEKVDSSGDSSIWVVSAQGGLSMHVVSQANLPSWSPDGKYIMYEASNGNKKSLARIEAPQEVKTGHKIPFFAQLKIDLEKENGQVFDEAWQIIQTHFYDSKFHGIDWKKMKEKYRPIALRSKTTYEVNSIIMRMLGELNASHMGISGPHNRQENQTGYLGWTLKVVPGQKGFLVEKVLKNSPADKAWIREGDHILKVENTVVTPQTNMVSFLQNKVGKKIRVYVAAGGNINKGRYVNLSPVSQGHIQTLHYHKWLGERISLTHSLCKGKVLYYHISEMNQANLVQFRSIVKRLSQVMDGMVLDVRNNVGGLIHEELLATFIIPPYAVYRDRDGASQTQPEVYWDKPVVLLINGKSYSDAEVFAHAFQELKLGPVLGTPTPGEIIGTRDVQLSNGATFRVPRRGYYTLQGQNLEGQGVKPDYNIPISQEDLSLGQDPQLIKATEVVLGLIEERKKIKNEALGKKGK